MILLLCSVCMADVVCYIGGSSADPNNGGWALSTVTAANAVGTNGAFKYFVLAADPSESADPAGTTLTKSAEFAVSLENIFAYCDATGDMADGRYKILASTANTITIDLTWNALYDDDTVTVYVGGALTETESVIQAALDSPPTGCSAAAQNQTYLIYDGGDGITATAGIDIDADSPGNTYYKILQGCNSLYVPLTTGNYITYSGTPAAAIIRIGGQIQAVRIKGFAISQSSGTPDSGDDGIFSAPTGTARGYYIENCSFSNVHDGVNFLDSDNGPVVIKDCVFTDIEYVPVYAYSPTVVENCYIEGTSTGAIVCVNVGPVIANHCVFDGGAYAFYTTYAATSVSVFQHCTFYAQTTAALLENGAVTQTLVALNCIFDVADTANDYAIRAQQGRVVEWNNITDADTAALSGFITSTGYNLDFTATDPLVLPASGDFRLNIGETICDTYALDKGTRVVMSADADDTDRGYSSIGAWQATQTQSGGGGGGGAIIGGGIVR